MKLRTMLVIGILTIVSAIFMVEWFVLKPQGKQLTPEFVFKVTKGTADKTSEKNRSPEKTEEPKMTPAERRAQKTRQNLNNFYQEIGQDKHDYAQELMRAMDSPAYIEYMKRQHETPGFSFKLWFDYLESQGVESHRNMYEDVFREYYPTGDLASYEPMM